ncbi:insulin-like growth factor-binding protein complex acid labile subunit [Tribolium castaneum]|uniref:Chaoptin-like Protein n=1 Tax=Tribolium castaneum TaxID=7070 RepID=D6WWY6_TRICA|nr:PREDICTED: insulin-like growth factor-binding protein complex acid labile subunit [Tribolium castaneum]EFA08073.1 Chaoptin-like Protein [Tribolium castaneum]|eukprot:XP_968000.1 PREDICTED: insulin-like growth factor-binding protein complex acid labile subunit [Tribolium castaneum]
MNSFKFPSLALLLVLALPHTLCVYLRMSNFDLMKCSYGERGSLTATCVNATSSYFKNTPYRFDHLDETLRCVNCSLHTLETGSFDISGNQIKNLDLTNSLIETVRQKAFVGLIFLQRLILANNAIKSIYPGTFTGVKKITYVDLENNSISILSDDGFLELINLEELNLRHNEIKSIATSAFNGLVHLQELDLSYNAIGDINGVFNNLTSLRLLDLSYNKISVLTGKEFDNLTSLLEIRFKFNHITTIPASEFYSMSRLRRLDLSFNAISGVRAGSFKGLHALEILDLGNNAVAEVPQKTLQSLHNLQYLNFSNNRLSIFQTGLYSGLPQLRVLNFSHNVIEDIEITGVFSLDSLDTLDFSFNNISNVDYVRLISRLPKISYLNLEDNLLPCGLEKEMEDYFAEDNFKFILYRNEANAVKCVQTDALPKNKHTFHKDSLIRAEMGGSSANAWIFVLIGITLVLVCVLYYLQLRTYQEMRSMSVKRTTSEVQLISSDLESRDNDYLKE